MQTIAGILHQKLDSLFGHLVYRWCDDSGTSTVLATGDVIIRCARPITPYIMSSTWRY